MIKISKINQNMQRVSRTGASSQKLVTVLENGQWGLNLSVLDSEMGFAIAGEQ